MAGADDRMSAAWRISLAASTWAAVSTCTHGIYCGKRGAHLGLGGNDLALADPLALGGHGERLLKLLAEDDVLDEHALDLDAPSGGHILYDLANALGDLLAALNDVLQHAGAHDVAEGGLGALDQGLADVGDAEGGLVRRDDVVVDDA